MEKNESDSDVIIDEPEKDDALSKALDSAINTVSRSLRKARSDDEEDYDEENEEEEYYEEEPLKKKKKKMGKSRRYYYADDDDEPDFSVLAKSIPETIQDDDEAGEVMDAMPLVAAIADAIDEQITALTKAVVVLTDKVDDLEGELLKSQRLNVAAAKMLKSVKSDVDAFAELPLPRKSVINTRDLTIMRKSKGGGNERITLSKADALYKLTVLCKSQKITIEEATTAESRIQKGQALPENIRMLLLEGVV